MVRILIVAGKVVLALALVFAVVGGTVWATRALWQELSEIVKQVEGFDPSLADRVFLLGLLAVAAPFFGVGTLMFLFEGNASPEELRQLADCLERVREERRRNLLARPRIEFRTGERR
jgi:hypothetical protein